MIEPPETLVHSCVKGWGEMTNLPRAFQSASIIHWCVVRRAVYGSMCCRPLAHFIFHLQMPILCTRLAVLCNLPRRITTPGPEGLPPCPITAPCLMPCTSVVGSGTPAHSATRYIWCIWTFFRAISPGSHLPFLIDSPERREVVTQQTNMKC